MNNYIKSVFIAVLALCALSSMLSASAAVPDGLNYQAYLSNVDGTPVDTTISIAFAAYNVDFGGVPLWSQTQTVAVEQGLFSVTLGSPANPFPPRLFDTPVYIGLFVAGEEMLPRRMLTTAAYAFKASVATSVPAGSVSSVEIADNSVSGRDILNGSIDSVEIADNSVSGTDILNGSITGADIATNAIGATHIGSSAVGTSELAVSAVSGTNIAANAVTSAKTLDEAGTAYASSPTDVILSTTGLATNVVQRTISVPTSGFVLANGRANFQIEHTGGIASEVFLSVSANSGVLDIGNLSRHRITSPDTFGAHRISLAVTDVFAVGAGTHTFYMVAESDEGTGVDRVMDANLSLLFVPTSYGTVSRERAGPETILADDR